MKKKKIIHLRNTLHMTKIKIYQQLNLHTSTDEFLTY